MEAEAAAAAAASGDIVIVGAGIAGLTISLGLHRLGIRSVVLESSESLRSTGFAFLTWTNAWKALDAIGLGDLIRQQHQQLLGLVATSTVSGQQTFEMSLLGKGKHGKHEVRCVRRKSLLKTLEEELPRGTIRYCSKVVSIEESGNFKLVHLADGAILKAKVLIGCDGVNSVVAKWLGLTKPASTGRFALRGMAHFKEGHAYKLIFQQFFGKGLRSGLIPCDDRNVYWFFTWTPSTEEERFEENPAKLKQLVLAKFENLPDQFRAVLENTDPDSILSSPLMYRYPWEVLGGNIRRGNVCVAGDAFHPMTPDMAQGACSALEDGVVLARCLAEALLKKPKTQVKYEDEESKEESERIEMALKKYAVERKWRAFDLISWSYTTGCIQQSAGKVMNFLRDKILPAFLAQMLLRKADYDCGKLNSSS